MSKVLRIAAAAVLVVVGAVTANPGLIALGISIGASALLQKKPAGTQGGDPTRWKADPFAGIPYLIGRTLTAGNIVYRRTHDSNNRYETFVTVLSGAGPIQSIDAFFANRTTVTFDGSGNAIGPYRNQIRQNWQLGAAGAAALAVLAGSPPGWTASSKLSGMAASMMSFTYDSKANPPFTSEISPAWIAKGVKVYDPRLDSTYPGGSGSCRALDESTYVWSENPALHGLTWCLGRWQNGKRVLGMGAPIASIDVAAFVEAANIADANGWKAGGVVYSRPDTGWTVLKSILQACSARPVKFGGRISCLINTPRVSLATITDADIVGECSLAATQPRRSRINGVLPRYRSEAHDWQVVAADLVQVSSYVTADGDERTKDIEYALVQDATQATRLAAYDIANSRELGPGTFPLKPYYLNFRPGDCVTINSVETGAVKMLIENRDLDPDTGIVTFTTNSETDAKHSFALGLTGGAPPTATLPGYSAAVTAPASGAWTLTGGTVASADGAAPALFVTGAVETPNADAVIFEYRKSGDTDWITAGTDPPAVTKRTIAAVAPNTAYEVAVRYEVRGALGDRRVLGPATTGSFASATSDLIRSVVMLNGGVSPLSGVDTGGGTAKVVIAANEWDYPNPVPNVTRAAGEVTGLSSLSTVHVYFDDATLANTTPVYAATTSYDDARSATDAHPYRHYLGKVTLPASGGGSTGGGGGGGGGGSGPIPLF